jgi:hypothetical protein
MRLKANLPTEILLPSSDLGFSDFVVAVGSALRLIFLFFVAVSLLFARRCSTDGPVFSHAKYPDRYAFHLRARRAYLMCIL